MRTPRRKWVSAAAGLLACGSMRGPAFPGFPSGMIGPCSPPTVAGAAPELPDQSGPDVPAFPFNPAICHRNRSWPCLANAGAACQGKLAMPTGAWRNSRGQGGPGKCDDILYDGDQHRQQDRHERGTEQLSECQRNGRRDKVLRLLRGFGQQGRKADGRRVSGTCARCAGRMGSLSISEKISATRNGPCTPFKRRSSSRSAIWPALSPQINAPHHRGLQLGTPARPHLGEGRDRCPYLLPREGDDRDDGRRRGLSSLNIDVVFELAQRQANADQNCKGNRKPQPLPAFCFRLVGQV